MRNLFQTQRREATPTLIMRRRGSPKRHEPLRTPAASLHPETETAPRLARDKSRRCEIGRILPRAWKKAVFLRNLESAGYPGWGVGKQLESQGRDHPANCNQTLFSIPRKEPALLCTNFSRAQYSGTFKGCLMPKNHGAGERLLVDDYLPIGRFGGWLPQPDRDHSKSRKIGPGALRLNFVGDPAEQIQCSVTYRFSRRLRNCFSQIQIHFAKGISYAPAPCVQAIR